MNEITAESNSFDTPSEVLYESLGVIYSGIGSTETAANGSGDAYERCLADLKAGTIGWQSHMFESCRKDQYEEDQKLENPLEIKDGDIPCRKCKGRKVLCIQQQTRSADEGFTTKVICFNPSCKYIETLN